MKKRIEPKDYFIKTAWQEISEVFQELHTSKDGLSIEEAEIRKNEKRNSALWEKKEDTICYRIRRSFLNPFIGVLLFLSVISFVTNHWLQPGEQRSIYSALILLIMVFISGGIRFSQEIKSRQASEQMERLVHMSVKIKRGDVLLDVSAKELVPGDCVYLTAGSRIPADLRLTNTMDLFVSQAAISGESAIVEKNCKKYVGEKKSSVIQYPNLVFMGTTVISGKGEGVVLAAGRDTLYGKSYTEGLKKTDSFEKGANSIAKVMFKFMMVLVPVVFLISGITKGNWLEAFLFAISVVT